MACTPLGTSFKKENVTLCFLWNLNVDHARQPASPEQYSPTWKLEDLQWMTYTILERFWGQGDSHIKIPKQKQVKWTSLLWKSSILDHHTLLSYYCKMTQDALKIFNIAGWVQGSMSLKSATCFMLLVHLSLNQHHFKCSEATSGHGYCPAQGSPRGNRRAVWLRAQCSLCRELCYRPFGCLKLSLQRKTEPLDFGILTHYPIIN